MSRVGRRPPRIGGVSTHGTQREPLWPPIKTPPASATCSAVSGVVGHRGLRTYPWPAPIAPCLCSVASTSVGVVEAGLARVFLSDRVPCCGASARPSHPLTAGTPASSAAAATRRRSPERTARSLNPTASSPPITFGLRQQCNDRSSTFSHRPTNYPSRNFRKRRPALPWRRNESATREPRTSCGKARGSADATPATWCGGSPLWLQLTGAARIDSAECALQRVPRRLSFRPDCLPTRASEPGEGCGDQQNAADVVDRPDAECVGE